MAEFLVSVLVGLVVVGGLVRIVLFLGDKTMTGTYSENILSYAAKQFLGFGGVGFFAGGLVGFLLRPSAPLIGQLDFSTVITRGSDLRGIDQLLISIAQTSFNYLLAGAIIGGIAGIGLAYVLSKRKEARVESGAA